MGNGSQLLHFITTDWTAIQQGTGFRKKQLGTCIVRFGRGSWLARNQRAPMLYADDLRGDRASYERLVDARVTLDGLEGLFGEFSRGERLKPQLSFGG